MREYELTVLIHPDLEMNLEPALAKIKELVEKNGGKIAKEVNEGKKRLAYKIKEQEFAVYYYYELELPATAPQKIASALNITGEVIRYLLVLKDPRREKLAEKRKEGQEEGQEASAKEGEPAEAEVSEQAETPAKGAEAVKAETPETPETPEAPEAEVKAQPDEGRL